MLPFSEIVQNINNSTYKLDLSGVVGLFGGDSAADALKTIHLYAGRRWAGWYNYPGAVTVAKCFGQMAESPLWDSMFPGANESPAITFNLAGKPGPDYTGSFSGTKLRTGYLGYLAAEECKNYPSKLLELYMKDGKKARKTGSSATVTIISLPPRQHDRVSTSSSNSDSSKKKPGPIPINPKSDSLLAPLAIVPSLVSILACVLCFVTQDLLCASLILLGIVSSGFSSLILGTATLEICVPVPSMASPKGDGLMFPEDGSIIVLKGEEADVNIITKGEFELDYSAGILPHQKHHTIGMSSLLLLAQFLVQLLLIPLSSFFGQIMFLISFIASGSYHLYVVSHEREKVHRELLFRELAARREKWLLGTRTQMAVFVCLLIGNGCQHPLKSSPDAILSRIIPNETPVWSYFRRKVVKELTHFWSDASFPYTPTIQPEPEPEDKADMQEHSGLTDKDKELLNDLIGDAWCVFNRYPKWRDAESEIWLERDSVDESSRSGLLSIGTSPV